MLTIRLSRVGKKNKPMYRLVISEKARDPYGHALEILGSYNPHTKELNAKSERIKYWISKGSQMSPTVNNLLIDKKVIEGEKVKASIARKKKKGQDDSKQMTDDSGSEKKPAEEKKEDAKPGEEAKSEAPTEEVKEAPKEEKKEGEKTEEKTEEPQK